MMPIFRLILATMGLVLLAPASFVAVQLALTQGAKAQGAQAQAQAQGAEAEAPTAPQQVALTQTQIDNLLAAQPEIAALQQQQAQSADPDQPDAKIQAKATAVAKKHGFASLAAYEQAVDSVAVVLAGMDPETKSYVGPAVLIKKQMAQIEADKTLPPLDKAKALKEMKEAMASAVETKPMPGNIDLVAKNYGKIAEAFQTAD